MLERHYDREVKAFKERPKNIYDLLQQNVHYRPNQIALIYENQSITYKELWQQVEWLSHHLVYQYGLKKGDKIAAVLGNSIEYCLLIYACAHMGAVLVPLNTRLKEKELEYMINHSQAKAIVVDSEFFSPINHLKNNFLINRVEHFFLIDKKKEFVNNGFYSFHSLIQKTKDAKRIIRTSQEDDPLFIMYTSGTTGLPKGAVGSHFGIIHSLINYESAFRLTSDTRTLIAVPLFHVTGLIGQLLLMAKVGGTAVLMRRHKTNEYVDLLFDHKISFLFNVPTIYTMALTHERFKIEACESVRCIAYGGAPMPRATMDQLRQTFNHASLHNCYGATETCSPTTIMPMNHPESKMMSVGLPVLGAEVKVINERGEECPPNYPGELLIKGAMVIEGYWDNEEANKKSFEDAFWKSGDVAAVDEDGFVYIMDRKKDMINRGGEKIFSIEIENVLHLHPKILEAAVVGVADKLFGEVVKAFIVPLKGEMILEKEVKQFVAERLADYKVPAEVEFLKELKKNPNGKILKNLLRTSVKS